MDLAYATLRRRILDGDFAPGSRLAHEAEAQRLSMRRMPIREAMRRLENEVLVEIQSHRASYVRRLSPEVFRDPAVRRIALGGIAGRLGVERLDAAGLSRMQAMLPEKADIVAREDGGAWFKSDGEFHETLYAGPRRPRLLSVIKGLREEGSRYRLLGLAKPREMDLGLRDHHAMVTA